MKYRVRFEKKGNMKFVGHLDIMRYYQKAIRRAGFDVAYSEGYNPHMIMSFASPLGIGLTSDAEYFDIDLLTPVTTREAIEALNRKSAEGLAVTGFVRISDEKSAGAMQLVAAADYTVTFREGHAPDALWEEQFSQFLSATSLPVMKKTKHSEKEVDIRPLIYRWSAENGKIFLQTASGSAANLKPELVMDTFFASLHRDPDPYACEINRCEIYADLGKEGTRKLVSLYDLGEETGE